MGSKILGNKVRRSPLGKNCINYCVSGNKIEDLSEMLDNKPCDMLYNVIVWIGTNNI